MTQPPLGRPPNPLNPDASHAARLGAEIRARRKAQGLTLNALAELIGFSPQHLSEVELAKTPMSGAFVAACDSALEARGSLLDLLQAVLNERAMQRHENSAARDRSEGRETLNETETQALASALGLERYPELQYPSEAEEDVDPLNRRSLLGAGAGAALGLSATTAPAAAREIDPGLASHWVGLLRVLAHHDAMFGPHEVLGTVRHSL